MASRFLENLYTPDSCWDSSRRLY